MMIKINKAIISSPIILIGMKIKYLQKNEYKNSNGKPIEKIGKIIINVYIVKEPPVFILPLAIRKVIIPPKKATINKINEYTIKFPHPKR